jgi:HD superfamily phosphohydrolase
LFDIIEHPYFQRLRRIKQVSLTHYVYPGALHTRFHHALGAMHLMQQALDVLNAKKVKITKEERKAALIAILLHDIGHGPFSHTLEHTLMNVHHETLSTLYMKKLNEEFNGALDLAIEIFENRYKKKFLYQLVSGQLDMDRMDYLNRDSFFTGVSEGVIGHDRIIKMLSVRRNELVVEEKGIYSLEKFLMARRLMYWQVYLHKTVLCAEQMLIITMRRAKELVSQGEEFNCSSHLNFFFKNDINEKNIAERENELLHHFALIDDIDIMFALKSFTEHKDKVLSFLAKSLINRRLFKISLQNKPFKSDFVKEMRHKTAIQTGINKKYMKYFVLSGKETNHEYNTSKNEIKILFKDGTVKPMSESTDYGLQPKMITKYYLCYPKNIT